jgi:hypothetical protein
MMLERSWPDGLRLRVCLPAATAAPRAAPRSPFRLVNHYGPTENTVVTTWAAVELGDGAVPPIGRPIDNVQIYVLDVHGQPAPPEFQVSSASRASVAAGYRNLHELTATKFVENPFSGAANGRHIDGRSRYARTVTEFWKAGRARKLRGFRVEPGKSRNAGAASGRVRAVVAARDRVGDQRLVAYVGTERWGTPAQGGERRSASKLAGGRVSTMTYAQPARRTRVLTSLVEQQLYRTSR